MRTSAASDTSLEAGSHRLREALAQRAPLHSQLHHPGVDVGVQEDDCPPHHRRGMFHWRPVAKKGMLPVAQLAQRNVFELPCLHCLTGERPPSPRRLLHSESIESMRSVSRRGLRILKPGMRKGHSRVPADSDFPDAFLSTNDGFC